MSEQIPSPETNNPALFEKFDIVHWQQPDETYVEALVYDHPVRFENTSDEADERNGTFLYDIIPLPDTDNVREQSGSVFEYELSDKVRSATEEEAQAIIDRFKAELQAEVIIPSSDELPSMTPEAVEAFLKKHYGQ
jgi:hypothetical protein